MRGRCGTVEQIWYAGVVMSSHVLLDAFRLDPATSKHNVTCYE